MIWREKPPPFSLQHVRFETAERSLAGEEERPSSEICLGSSCAQSCCGSSALWYNAAFITTFLPEHLEAKVNLRAPLGNGRGGEANKEMIFRPSSTLGRNLDERNGTIDFYSRGEQCQGSYTTTQLSAPTEDTYDKNKMSKYPVVNLICSLWLRLYTAIIQDERCHKSVGNGIK
ncbi:unnamed protein product [Ranitomeya imitator]|uniref:Uncharacterized protein n=1 Tax=Ranitomeya imitator TaxID=111125 RepID=A0ABN9KWE9_9NEOB|nr:unnamed protein product [Ranitomeya imitator]